MSDQGRSGTANLPARSARNASAMTSQSVCRRWLAMVPLLVLPLITGCAAFRPIHGLPARYMPVEFKGPTRSGKQTIDLSLLRQNPPAAHLVDTGDLLSIYVEGVLGRRDEQPPVFFPTNSNSDIPPTVGYPIPVRDDGSISLPLVGSVNVRGMTIRQVEDVLRKAYTVDHAFLQPGRDRLFVALQQPRTFRILVIRQEASSDISIGTQGQLNIGALKRGTGKVVNLPAYKNDVLNALAETGGLPGLDAENAIYIIRQQNRQPYCPPGGQPAYQGTPTPVQPVQPVMPPQWQPEIPPPPQSLHPREGIIRGQSPGGFNPQADYRSAPILQTSAQAATGGWSQPTGRPGAVMPAAYQPAVPPVPAVAPTPLPPTPGLSPQAAPGVAPPHSMMPMAPPAGNWSQPQMNPTATPQPGWAPPSGYAPAIPGHAPALPMPPSAGWSPAVPETMPAPGWDQSMPPVAGTVGDWPVNIDERLNDRHIIRIPVRLGPGEYTNITESDIILQEGDIGFIEAGETEVFYTGGLLGGGQYTLARGYDLDVLGAIAVAQGRGNSGGSSRATQSQGGQSALNNDVSISASQLIVLRPLPDGTQLTIQIDLYEAIRNPNERIIVQPGDYLLLQYTRCEAVMAFIERHLLEGALFGVAAAQLNQGN